jgi:hypothetical protein
MNVLRKEATTVTQILPATILLDHLHVRVILAILEMEVFVKVCQIIPFMETTVYQWFGKTIIQSNMYACTFIPRIIDNLSVIQFFKMSSVV